MEVERRRIGERDCSCACTTMSSSYLRPLAFSLLFLLLSCCDEMIGASASNYTTLRLARIQRHLERINKPAAKTIQVRKTPEAFLSHDIRLACFLIAS